MERTGGKEYNVDESSAVAVAVVTIDRPYSNRNSEEEKSDAVQ